MLKCTSKFSLSWAGQVCFAAGWVLVQEVDLLLVVGLLLLVLG